MEFTRNFTNLGRNDASLAGGKGASLGEMTQAGIPVPPGFVVLADTFEQFIKETDLIQEIDAILATVDHKEIHTVESASEKIQALIKNAQTPEDIKSSILKDFDTLGTEFVAVRSSATAEDGQDHAWAGQLDSYLNVTRDTVLEKVQHCWASLFTPRAIFYRFEKGLDTTKISVAVVVQKMVNSEVSGIAFSVHPVTEDRNQLIIEAGYGLGEAIVSGQITPDSYVVEKEPRNILDINVSEQSRGLFRKTGGGNEWKELGEQGEKQVLTGLQINELSDIIVGIENHYGFPCDIEWAFEQNKFYIVQSRPITTLSNSEPLTEESKKKISLENFVALGEWVCPVLEFELWLDWSNTKLGETLKIPNPGIPSVTIDGHYFRYKDDGYSFIKEKVLQELESGRLDFINLMLQKAEEFSLECVSYSKKVPEKLSFLDFEKYYEILKKLRLPWMSCFPIDEAVNLYLKKYTESKNIPFDDLVLKIPQLSNSLTEDQKRLVLFKKSIEEQNLDFDISTIETKDSDLAKEIRQYQKETEYIGTHHMWGEPRTLEKLFSAIKNSSENIEKEKQEVSTDIAEILETMAKVSKWRLECAQSSAQLSYALRPAMINFAEEISISYDDLIQLTTKEIKEALENKSLNIDTLKQRYEKFASYKENEEMHILVGEEYEKIAKDFNLNVTYENISQIKGNIGNKGKIIGEVCIIRKPQDMSKMQKGMILVAPETTPDFIPAMGLASAFVTDIGGITSHAAIVAREMNKPCITGTKNATKILKDGDAVEVDADTGVVTIIKNQIHKFNSKELQNFDVHDYRYFGLWKNDILSSAFWQDCHNQDTLNKLGLSMKETGCLSLYGGHFLVRESLCNEVEEQIAQKILEEDTLFFENVKSVTDSILQASVEYGKTIPGIKVTVENVEKLFTELRKVNFIWYLGASHLVNAAEKVLSDAVVEEKFPAEYVLDIIPPVVSPLSIQQKEVLRLKKIIGDRSFEEVKKDTELIKELDEHAKKYSWIEILNLVGDLVTTERLFEQIQHTKEVKEVEEKSIPQISDSLKFKAWAMYICGYVKQVSAEYFSMLTANAYYFLRDIANELNLEYRQFTLLCPKEIIAGLKGEISKEELKAKALSRTDLNWLLFVPENNTCSVVEDKEDVEKLKDSMLPKIDESALEIKGVTAYPGKIRGVARIVMNRDEFDKMQTGDILVSTMTTPDFVILMQQASAIVTDIGGLLCHAAIVSREIHKPCIIGTKVATQVIKDGDTIEVDADNRVIRIIK